ncbi:Uncharacterised protein [Chlamydia trachomatis]|nr:Uncharacterised protein [Chlamydia trachomatis]
MYIAKHMNNANKTGIITLFAFSIPPAIPMDIIIKLTIIAITIHILAPPAPAV